VACASRRGALVSLSAGLVSLCSEGL